LILLPFVFAMVRGPINSAQQPSGYQGARAILAKMRAPETGSALGEPKLVLVNDIAAFGDRVTALSPQEAASEWLALARREFDQVAADEPYFRTSEFSAVVNVLPSPDAWPLIEKELEKGSKAPGSLSLGLRLLFAALEGDYPAARACLKILAPGPRGPNADFDPNPVALDLALKSHDRDGVEAALREETDNPRKQSIFRDRSGPEMTIPDLVPVLGEQRARNVLTYVLLHAKAELSFSQDQLVHSEGDRSTKDLARKIAVEHANEIAYPQWTLSASPEAGDLYLKLRKRFPRINLGIALDNPASWSTYQGGAVHCLANLFASNGGGSRAGVRTEGFLLC
jgi:hypothetical protein